MSLNIETSSQIKLLSILLLIGRRSSVVKSSKATNVLQKSSLSCLHVGSIDK